MVSERKTPSATRSGRGGKGEDASLGEGVMGAGVLGDVKQFILESFGTGDAGNDPSSGDDGASESALVGPEVGEAACERSTSRSTSMSPFSLGGAGVPYQSS